MQSAVLYAMLGLCGLASCKSLVVQTTNGQITGHPAANRSSVTEYLGIPYAQPPLGDLRFAAPVAYSGKAPLKASTWGFDCPATPSAPYTFNWFTPQAQRIINYFAGGAGTPQSEDCLTLNIWTPSSATAGSKPVLIFFYGGRFTIGNTNTPFHNGQFLADAEDVVVVTLNYRLNIFGFPGIPNGPQNLGLKDQRLAVEWIQNNIKGFGGDCSKLTIFGQSSGGVAVDYWSFAYADDPIVSSFVSHSGNALSFPLNAASLTTSNWYNVTAQLGCGASGDALACMRTKKWTDIKAAAARVPAVSGGSPLRSVPAFYPSVDNVTVFSNYTALSNAGKFAKLPYLLGNNNNEQGYYVLPVLARGGVVTKAQEDTFLLSSFTCANKAEADNRKAYGVPVWQFRYFGDWDNLRLYTNNTIGEGSGTYHGSDLEMIFANDQQVSGIPPSIPEQETTTLMQHAWAVFANDPVNGLTKLGWPKYDPKAESLILLAYNNSPVAEFVSPSVYDSPCSTVTLGAVQTGT